MTEEKLLLEYRRSGAFGGSSSLKLYLDGRLEFKRVYYVHGKGGQKETIEKRLSSEELQKYVNMLVNSGFFNIEDEFIMQSFDGTREVFILNYEGKTKKVERQNALLHCNMFSETIKELEELARE